MKKTKPLYEQNECYIKNQKAWEDFYSIPEEYKFFDFETVNNLMWLKSQKRRVPRDVLAQLNDYSEM